MQTPFENIELSMNCQVMEASLSYKNTGKRAFVGKLDQPEKAVEYLTGAFEENPEVESFWVIACDVKHQPKYRQMITLGTATTSLAHPREVFRLAILAGAAAIIVAHNHPSGDPAPSKADMDMTRRLVDSGRILGINVADHIIIGNKEQDPNGRGWFSFASSGLL